MSVVLYVLGAGLLVWSAYTVLGGDTFAAIDIAASLAGWGAFAVGLGALTAAIGKLTNTVAANGRAVSKALARSAAARPSTPSAEEKSVVRKLPAAAALPPEGAEETEPVEEPKAPLRIERSANRREPVEDPVLEQPQVVRPILGGGVAARLEQDLKAAIAAAEPQSSKAETSKTEPSVSEPAPKTAPRAIVAPPVTLRADRPRVERAPAVITPKRDDDVRKAKVVAQASTAPEPQAQPEEPAKVAAGEAPPAPAAPEPVEPEAAGTPTTVAGAETPPEVAQEEVEAPAAEPAAVEAAASEPEPSAEPEPAPEPVAEAAEEPAPAPAAEDDPKVPEWLARARARRRARLEPEDEAPTAPRREPKLDVPPAPKLAEETPPAAGPTLIREGEHGGVTYRFYDDESVEAVSPHGVRRFASVEELRATVQSARGRDAGQPPVEPVAQPALRAERDALDAALAELEGKLSGEISADPRDRIERLGRG